MTKKKHLYLESRIPHSVSNDLSKKGHNVRYLEDYAKFMGHAQAIQINPDGTHIGAADPRSDGSVLGR